MSHCSNPADDSAEDLPEDLPVQGNDVASVAHVGTSIVGDVRGWRIITEGAGDAAWNMAVDEALLNGVAANTSPPTVRLYGWQRPALTIGRFQNVARTIDREMCAQLGLPIVRRLTGGRGIRHGSDLTVCVACAVPDLGIVGRSRPTTLDLYSHTAQWFVSALREVGIEAQAGQCDRVRGQDRIGNCFDVVSRADIVEIRTGRKVLGSALYRRGDHLLQQISIPVISLLDGHNLDGYNRTGDLQLFRGREPATGDADDLLSHRLPDAERLQGALVAAICQVFTDVWIVTSLSHAERAAADLLVARRYNQERWNLDGFHSSLPCN